MKQLVLALFLLPLCACTTTFQASLSPQPLSIQSFSKDACKKNGWQSLRTKDGRPFKNQGDCVSYANATH